MKYSALANLACIEFYLQNLRIVCGYPISEKQEKNIRKKICVQLQLLNRCSNLNETFLAWSSTSTYSCCSISQINFGKLVFYMGPAMKNTGKKGRCPASFKNNFALVTRTTQ